MRLGVSSESSAGHRIHMKNQALFSSKDKSKKLICRLLQYLFGALRVNCCQRLICLGVVMTTLAIFFHTIYALGIHALSAQ